MIVEVAVPSAAPATGPSGPMMPETANPPRLLSLERANVAGLGLGNVSLADCRFNGAHNLDQLRMEADVAFGLSPARVGWEQRQVIAEESAWRANAPMAQTRRRHLHSRWAAPRWPDWAGSGTPAVLNPGAIAGLYRALRKGREDAKDEPGAADFYYGEMEMRRGGGGVLRTPSGPILKTWTAACARSPASCGIWPGPRWTSRA